jgi:hypothetical protein
VNPANDPEPVVAQGIAAADFAGLLGAIEHGDAYGNVSYGQFPCGRDSRLVAVISRTTLVVRSTTRDLLWWMPLVRYASSARAVRPFPSRKGWIAAK